MRTFVPCGPLLLAVLASGCGPKAVQLYDGPKLPDSEVIVLWSNPHLAINVDRSYDVPAEERAKLHRIELPPGHHAVEVRCFYTKDVPYHPAKGGEAAPGEAPAQDFTESPTIALLLDGQAGRSYKPRVHFQRNAAGVPGCRVKLFDVTEESGGHKVHLY